MSKLQYYVERYTVNSKKLVKKEYGAEQDIAEKLTFNSEDTYELKQIIPLLSNGNTDDMFFVYSQNPELISTHIFFDNDEISDDMYLTGSQLKLINDIGFIEVDVQKYKVEEVILSWNTERKEFYATINTTDLEN